MAGTANAGATTGTGDGQGGVKDQAQEKAQEVREQAGEQARKAAGQARGALRDQVDQRSTDAGSRVSEQAGNLRSVAAELRNKDQEGPARIADQVADRAQRAGSWLTESDADRILEDVEDFARRNPWAVAAGGLALGFVASRVLKASSSRRYEQRSTRQLPPPRSTAARPVTPPPVDEPLANRSLGTPPATGAGTGTGIGGAGVGGVGTDDLPPAGEPRTTPLEPTRPVDAPEVRP